MSQIRLKQTFITLVFVLSSITLFSCKGEDITTDEPATDSGKNPTISTPIDPNLSSYIVTELKLQGTFDPQQIKLDSERGVIFIPQGRLIEENDDRPSLAEIDLATGIIRDYHGNSTRIPSKLVVPSVTGHAIASVLSVNEETSAIYITSLAPLDSIDLHMGGFYFHVSGSIKELEFNNKYLFALNEGGNQIHQYSATTGEQLGVINKAKIDDWLIAYQSKKLYVLHENAVTEYDFSQGPVTATNGSPKILHATTSQFGWLNPDETRLYQQNGEVLRIPEFDIVSPELFTLSGARKLFMDIAFIPNSKTHYTIEGYSGTDGDLYLSPLNNHKAKPLGLAGRRTFVSSAGVHLYAYEDGKHMLYTLKQNSRWEYNKGENISVAPRWIRSVLSRYLGYELMYPFNSFTKVWPELYLNFNVVNVVEIRDYYRSDRIIVEPICINDDCAAGTYSMSIPLNRPPMHFSIRLKDWFQTHDIRALVGFRVRTPENSWDSFYLKNVTLSNAPAGCENTADSGVLKFCDD